MISDMVNSHYGKGLVATRSATKSKRVNGVELSLESLKSMPIPQSIRKEYDETPEVSLWISQVLKKALKLIPEHYHPTTLAVPQSRILNSHSRFLQRLEAYSCIKAGLEYEIPKQVKQADQK
mmetsp:Transcript_32116/g.49115  ORF Transcript_32116/g.49115 Transcript_32116/m.49115 type:complete len:122 (-) Transcript_32116:233-598(-)